MPVANWPRALRGKFKFQDLTLILFDPDFFFMSTKQKV
jgi:hypothetical protein